MRRCFTNEVPLQSLFGQQADGGATLMVLHGEPGTGKSVVVNAIQSLLKRLGLFHTCRVAAYTGKAATLIGGRTIHQWVLKKMQQHVLERNWKEAKLFIIDEFSMLKLSDLTTMASIIKKARNEESHPNAFGSLHVLLVGDQYQFPPVGGTPLHCQHVGNLAFVSRQGHHVWRQFQTVFFLEDQMRSPDPEWFPFLQRLRHAYHWDPTMGNLDAGQRQSKIDGDWEMLHRDTLLGGPYRQIHDPKWQRATMITPRNSVRIKTIRQLLLHKAYRKRTRVIQLNTQHSTHTTTTNAHTNGANSQHCEQFNP